LAYGRNYCADGRIDSPRDIFYLTKNEIFSGEGDFRALIAVRKAEEQQNIKKPTYNRVVFYGDIALPIQQGKQGEGLCGIPSGNGVVRANVSLMRTAADRLVQGNIILTERTDPGWITLFPQASGLIVERGSMLSHSFVVARELNLPAVVGVENATTVIPDGALVTLDGLKGEITVEDKGIL
jgi:pyruvate,water dikinase